MRAIIIDDKDAIALLERLKLCKFEVLERERSQMVSDIHSKFHYIVCSWLQDQGCDVVR